MAAVRFQPQPSISVRNTFLHCAEDESPASSAVLQPRSQTGPAGLFANFLSEEGLDGAPRGAKAAADSQASEEACSTSETGEWEEDERPLPIRSVRTRDFFEDTPKGSISVRTLDPFDDTPLQRMTSEQFEQAVHYEALPPSLQHGAQAPGEHAEPKPVALGTCGAASAALAAGVAAKIQIRNTFVHFSDDEGEETPGPRPGAQRRARATRTVPARILEGALAHEDSAEEQGAPATPPESSSSRPQESRCKESSSALPGQQLQSCLRDAKLAAAAATQPNQAPLAKAMTPEPMYVEQSPSTIKAAPRKPRHAEKAEGELGPRLTVSVRNTFLHIDEEAEGAEQTPVLHRRVDRRSKTGPPGTFALDEAGDESDEADDRRTDVAAASQPVKVPLAQEQPRDTTTLAPSQFAAVPPGMCMPFSFPPGVVQPFVTGFSPLAPFMAQIAAAQAAQLGHPVAPLASRLLVAGVAPQASPAPSVQEAPTKTSTLGSSSKRPSADRTTVVLQNLPLNYRRSMLLRMLDAEGFQGAYDFVYLPMDFKTRAGFGYAFINLADPSVVPCFWGVFDGYKKWMFPSAKVCRVSWSVPHQGLKAHIKRYRNSPLMHESVPDEYKPVLFAAGTRVAFPPPMKEIVAPSQKALTKAPKKGRKQAAS